MLSIRLRRVRSLPGRRFVTVVALIAYLASVWGFPIPVIGERDVSTPYPCQGHACGCRSADQCWHSCCCFTPAERLAWAAEHHVTIPAEARKELLAAVDVPAPTATCCHRHDDDHDHGDSADHKCAKCKSHDEPSVTWVLGIQARKCQGLDSQWIASGATLPVEISPSWQFDWTQVGRVISADDCASSPRFAPSTRPPIA